MLNDTLYADGHFLKVEGQELAAKKTGKEWFDDALDLLQIFLIDKQAFTFETFRYYAHLNGLPLPASNNAYGSLPKMACKAGLIKWSGGYTASSMKSAHKRVIKVWEVL